MEGHHTLIARDGATVPDSCDSLSQLAYKSVLSRILQGTLKPNEIVQEGRLANELGLSRTPMREAIGKLEGEGFLVRHGRTVMVQELTLEDYLEILHMRRLLEGEAAGMAAETDHANHAELQALRDEIISLENDNDAEAHWIVDSKLHELVARLGGSRLLTQTVADLRRRTILFVLDRQPGRLRNGRSEHLAIVDAVLAGDRAEAVAAMRCHLDSIRNDVLSSLQRFY